MATLLIIDPQTDFHGGGSLAVPGADEDAMRTNQFILSNMDKISRIVITLDSHHKIDIGHGGFWSSGSDKSKRPDPFTLITKEDIENRVWVPQSVDHEEYIKVYLDSLESKGRFKHIIWPEHCLIGTPGHAVNSTIMEAAHTWCDKHNRQVEWVIKGENPLTEMYSALAAEVPIESDAKTCMNQSLRSTLLPKVDDPNYRLIVCGQAMSHCVNFTLRDICAGTQDNQETDINRILLLSDCATPVAGFEGEADAFVNDMKTLGVRVCTSLEVFEE